MLLLESILIVKTDVQRSQQYIVAHFGINFYKILILVIY